MTAGNLSPLIIKYERILEEDPRSRVFAPLAEAYRKVGLLDNAFNTLKKGLRYNPDYLLGYLSLAQCYVDKGEYSLCYSTLRPLVSQNRDNIKLQKIFAISAEKTGNQEEALDTYKYLLFLQPKDEEISQKVKALESELEEGVIYTPKEEIKFNVEELKPSPENDRSLDDWVQVDLSPGKPIKDEAEAEEEVDDWTLENVNEDSAEVENIEEKATPVITHTLVDLYLQQGHNEKAIELLEKISEIQPDNEETLKRLLELKAIQNKNTDDQDDDGKVEIRVESKDEGRGNLMAAFDMAKDSTDEKIEVSSLKVAEVLDDFHELLRQKAQEQIRS